MKNCTQKSIQWLLRSAHLMLAVITLMAGTLYAQDPPQYGTPYSGVPDPRDVNMYQVNIRAFSSGSNLPGVTARLDNIKAVGTNVIYLMPVFPVGTDSRSKIASSTSPYSIKDFKSVGSEYGTLADLRALVDGAHARGMAVILDWVVNQTSWDHPWITQHPDYYVRDGNGVIQQLGDFSDVAALNFSSSAMRTAMIDAMRYWVFAANIDGFRCDYANNPPLDFWTQAIGNLRGITSHKLLMFAEGDRLENFNAGFDMNFGDKFYYDALKPIHSGTSVSQIQTTTNIEYTNASGSQQVVRYTGNHDTSGDGTPLEIFGNTAGVMANFVVCAYMRGVPFLYGGQEVAFATRIPWPWDGVDINWNQNASVTAEFANVLNFRTSSTAIRRGTMTNYSDANVCAFTKTSGTEKVVVLSNLRGGTSNYTLPAALAGSWKDAYSGASVTLTSGSTISLSGYQYRVFTNTNVAPVPVTGVNVSPTSTSISAGLTQQLTASVLPSNATNQTVNWSSSNSGVATVNASGLVTAVAAGTATITVTTQDGNKTATASITVTPATSFTVNFFKPSAWGTGIRIYWWAAQPAGVLADGTWPGVLMTNAGSGWYSYTFTNVTATNLIFNDGTNQTADLSRNKTGWYQNGVWYDTNPGGAIAVTGVTVSPTSTSVNVGSGTQLTATVSPSNATNKTVSWSSSNTGIATVNSSGIVSGISPGSATITVTTQDGNKTATSAITVNTLPQSAYPNGIAWAIPGTVEAENFDVGGEGTAYHDNDASNAGGQGRTADGVDVESCSEGGLSVGWTNAGEWLEYTVNVATAGNYDFNIRVASGGTGGTFRIEFNGVNKTGTLTAPGTGGWQTWQSVTKTGVALSAGTQVMRLYMISGGYNVNKVTITASGSSGTTTYYQIVNRWQSTSYLYDAGNGQVRYGTNPSGSSYQWQPVDAGGGYYLLKNRATGNLMHVENQNGSVQCSTADPTWWSAQWSLPSTGDGWINIINRWQTGERIHLENLLGYAQYSGAQNGWYSAMWQLVNPQSALKMNHNESADSESSNLVDIYPNPSHGNNLNIVLPQMKEGTAAIVQIHDTNGNVALQTTMYKSGKIEHNLRPGLYLINVQAGATRAVKKIIIE